MTNGVLQLDYLPSRSVVGGFTRRDNTAYYNRRPFTTYDVALIMMPTVPLIVLKSLILNLVMEVDGGLVDAHVVS